MKCDVCGSEELNFGWGRRFTRVEHGWDGRHEYWKCRECPYGAFIVVEFDERMDIKRVDNRMLRCVR